MLAVHAHIVLWVHKEDVEAAAEGIVACVPGVQNKDGQWECAPGADEVDQDLLQLVLGFQMHICRDFLCLNNKKKVCSKKFPFPEQYERAPKQDKGLGLWTYLRPGREHRNVIPYHPAILLSWRAHMNIQRITHSDWSRYLLK